MSQKLYDFTEPVSRVRRIHMQACWGKTKVHKMLPKWQKGTDVQMNTRSPIIRAGCFKCTQQCMWPQTLTLGKKFNCWIDDEFFFFSPQISPPWVFLWWHWGHCDLHSPSVSATDALCVLERLLVDFAKSKLEKKWLPDSQRWSCESWWINIYCIVYMSRAIDRHTGECTRHIQG